VKAYWWTGAPYKATSNFGDCLTPLLLEHFTGQTVEWAKPRDAEWIAVGSIATHIPKDWDGVVWGAGKMRRRDKIDLSKAKVLALRGELTAKDSGATGDYVLGDPGLLVSLLPGLKRTGEHPVGIVPHWQDRWLSWRQRGMTINPQGDPMTVIRQIASCSRIVSSSLHGIIVADAFGIERRWERAANATEFKFRDYMSVVGEFQRSTWSRVDRRKVKAAQQALLGVLQ
jgi:pyruvyltransferase